MEKDSRKKTAVEVVIDTGKACGIATCLNYTILPKYITTILSEICSTTERSWAINR